MDDLQAGDELAFSQEDVDKNVQEMIESTLNNVHYDEQKVPHWINQISEKVMKYLVDTGKPFKYMVTCTIMQRNGAGLISANSCFWDTVADGSVTVQWPKEKSKDNINKTMNCIITVFAISI